MSNLQATSHYDQRVVGMLKWWAGQRVLIKSLEACVIKKPVRAMFRF